MCAGQDTSVDPDVEQHQYHLCEGSGTLEEHSANMANEWVVLKRSKDGHWYMEKHSSSPRCFHEYHWGGKNHPTKCEDVSK